MARPRKNDPLDLSRAIELTAGAIDRLSCPSDKTQAFLRDSKAPGLRVRVTSTGTKSFVFEGKLNRKTVRRTIGGVRSWTIEEARVEANRLRVTLDRGEDPREIERQKRAKQAALKAEESARALVAGVAWARYLEERKPYWRENTYKDGAPWRKASTQQARDENLAGNDAPAHADAIS